MRFELMVQGDLREAYSLLVSRTEELIAMGTGQYTSPFPSIEEFRQRIDQNQNWLIRFEHKIVGIVSMIDNGVGGEWPEVYRHTDHIWVASLFVGRDSKRLGVGDMILDRCKALASSKGLPILLDCYRDSGFLEKYYQARGFVTLDTKRFTYGTRSFEAALMQYNGTRGS